VASALSQALSVAVARVTTRSLNTKEMPATISPVTISGARIWCADSPDALSEMTSLFWLSVARVMSVPSSTEKGRKRAISCGTRNPA
jgi:hypothetical protein